MKILALETSTEVGSVCLLDHGKIVREIANRAPMNLLSWLAPAIQNLLKSSGVSFKDLDAIAVGQGPGSYTGVRLELSTAKTLAQVTCLPLYGVSSLDALAYQALPFEGKILSCVDARGGGVFAGIYERDENGIRRIEDYLAGPPAEILSRMKTREGPWKIIGEIDRHKLFFLKEIPDMTEAAPEADAVRASSVGRLAELRRESLSGNLFAVEPLYIKS